MVKGTITHLFIDLEIHVLLCLIDLMILNNCGKFRSTTRNGNLVKLENIYLHANLYVGIFLVQKGNNSSINQFRGTFLTLPNRLNDKEHLWKLSIQYMK